MTTRHVKSHFLSVVLMATAIATFSASVHAANYAGNGATGFGGPVGTGSVTLTDTLNSLTLTLNRGAGPMNDDLVLYLDTQAGGFPDTSSFADNADGQRVAISGFNGGNPSRTVAAFPAGFGADYAVSIDNGFIGVYQLASGGNGSLTFLFGQALSGNNAAASYGLTLTPGEMSQIGLTAGSGQTFQFVGSLVSSTAYRANETIGASVTTPGDGAGNAGFADPQTFLQALPYTLTTPEPATMTLLGLGVAAILPALRRRK